MTDAGTASITEETEAKAADSGLPTGGGGALRGTAARGSTTVELAAQVAARARDYAWNPFRYVADYLHLFGVVALLGTLYKNRSCAGVSRSTQMLYATIFLCRYIDLFTETATQNWYLIVFKTTYIVTSLVVLAIFWKMDKTYERQKDTCSLVVIVVPCVVASILLSKDSQSDPAVIPKQLAKNYPTLHRTQELLWTLSQFLEGFAMVPQYIFCYRDRGARDIGIMLYVICLGGYRVFYAANWIYKKLYLPGYSDVQSWLGGAIEISFFCDYLLSFTGLSLLRSMVLKVDQKINEIQEQVEMKVLGRAQRRAITVDQNQGGGEMRQRRRGNAEQQDASNIDI